MCLAAAFAVGMYTFRRYRSMREEIALEWKTLGIARARLGHLNDELAVLKERMMGATLRASQRCHKDTVMRIVGGRVCFACDA
jgi:hypothetical protein